MAGLSRWWPWRRSPAPTAPPTGSPTAAAWRSLAPVQRTVGDLAQTAGFDEFTASLTTAQRPGLVAAPETLATADVASLPVLGADAVPAAPAAPTAVPAPRTWRPALALPQRMSAAPPNVQRSVDPAPDASRSAAELEIPATGSAPELPSAPELFEAPALLQAPAPDDVRDVAVVPEPELAPEPVPATASAPAPVDAALPSESAPVTADDAPVVVAAPPPAAPVPAASSARAPSPPPRPAVQRATADPPRTEVAPPPRTPTRPPDTGRAAAPPAIPVQRLPFLTPPSTPLPPGAVSNARTPLPRPIAVDAATDPPTHHIDIVDDAVQSPAFRDVQRSTTEAITWFAPDDPVRMPTSAAPTAPLPTRRQVTGPVQRSAAAPPDAAPAPPRVAPTPPALQRDRTLTPPRSVPESSSPLRVAPSSAPRLPDHTAAPSAEGAAPVQRSTAAPPHEPPFPTSAPSRVVERLVAARELTVAGDAPSPHVPRPLAASTALQRTASGPPTLPHRTTAPPVATIQRSPFAGPAPAEERTARRLVVQPPLPARDTVTSRLFDTAAPSPALVADSPKPMSLQRIFARPAAPATPGDDAPSGAPATVTQHDGYTEVSFAPAQVQREAEETGESDAPAAPPAAQDAAPTSAAAVPPAPSPAPAGPNIDELVNRLYDPLAARLRSELWLDRERAGALMDVRR